ncbi:hypothetical protein AMIS_2430 [Actinoplanes missouriensis 431]|uniref:DUF7426 domain-containing protein n=1 Tax=Actinoplanes missouriensis (strain ATCC 14538 / DSM 43046 / CBS 188.64 / JCM 3121 / NBRC 102363 / NCIMB 12654 / NRRL B-3342 / UNCC 431) TaxID=512565 RepID=I0GXH6_ACTM4|nr:hypothetical protein [Actinoplanes missouriensis]KOX45261.1 hypothetical protein ADL19_23350 [Streptomyces purpurogeneiscleroticus]BAL85463.1 hypothetical protein AMIS_2430 [Actinoplanes missouriensis 431]
MAKLSGLREYFNPELTLAVPDRHGVEREYVIPPASAELGLWCQMLAEVTGRLRTATAPEELQEVFDSIENELPQLGKGIRTLEQRTLSTAYDLMVADGVLHEHIKFCGRVAYLWIVRDEDEAERYWKSGGRPGEAPGPANRAERRAAGRTNTAAAAETPKPGSSSTTRSRNGSSRNRRARGGRGQRSSNSGT